MRYRKSLVLFLALAGSLPLAACGAHTATDTTTCIGPRPVSDVHFSGRAVIFTMTSPVFTKTVAVPKSAFGGAPAAMKNGDLVRVCVETSVAGGHTTITAVTQFSDQGQPSATSTPPSS